MKFIKWLNEKVNKIDIDELNIPNVSHKYPKYKSNDCINEDWLAWTDYDIDPDMGDH
jgi:hypothetical protein